MTDQMLIALIVGLSLVIVGGAVSLFVVFQRWAASENKQRAIDTELAFIRREQRRVADQTDEPEE